MVAGSRTLRPRDGAARGPALLPLLLPLLLPGCGPDAPLERGTPPLPPLSLQPLLPELKVLAAPLAPVADADTARELRDYADIALQRSRADHRTAALAERALLEHERAGSVLVPALRDADAAVRARAAWLLGRTGRPMLQFPLLLALKDEGDPEAALWIADALHRLGNDSALGWLSAAMDTPVERAGTLALDLLREDGCELPEQPTWLDLQTALNDRLRQWHRTGLGCRDGVAPPPPDEVARVVAAHLAVTEGTALRPVDEARFVLTRGGAPVLPMLTRALSAEEPYLRTMALQVFAELGPTAHSVGPAILPLLGDPLTEAYAIRALGEVGWQPAAGHLRPRLAAGDTELRAAAAEALGLLADRSSEPALRRLLQDEDEALDVRVQAAFALSCLGDDPAAAAYLDERERRGDYHAPTLRRLRDRLAQPR